MKSLPFQPSVDKNNNLEKEQAFQSMEEIVNNKIISNSDIDYDAELASYKIKKHK
jgi:hypothetical protein